MNEQSDMIATQPERAKRTLATGGTVLLWILFSVPFIALGLVFLPYLLFFPIVLNPSCQGVALLTAVLAGPLFPFLFIRHRAKKKSETPLDAFARLAAKVRAVGVFLYGGLFGVFMLALVGLAVLSTPFSFLATPVAFAPVVLGNVTDVPVQYEGHTFYVSSVRDGNVPGPARLAVGPYFMERVPTETLSRNAGTDPSSASVPSPQPTAEISTPTQAPATQPSAPSTGAPLPPPDPSSESNSLTRAAPVAECPPLEPQGPYDVSTITFEIEATNGKGERFVVSSYEPPCISQWDGNSYVPLTGMDTDAEPYKLVAPGNFIVYGLGRASGGITYVSADGGNTWIEPKFPKGIREELGSSTPLFLHNAGVEQRSGREVLVLELGHPKWVQAKKTVLVESTDGGKTFTKRK